MKHILRLRVLIVAALVVLSIPLAGCKASDGRPTVLRFALFPASEQLQGAMRQDLLQQYLSAQLHMPVQVVSLNSYGAVIEAMRVNKVDLTTYGPLGYLVAAQKANAEAIVSVGNADGSLGGYRSVIAVPNGSPYYSLADLKAHAKDVTFSFADPASTSGNLYPRVGLLDAGIDPERDFKKVLFSDHIASLMSVKSGKVDAGAFVELLLTYMVVNNKMKGDDVRVIWRSEPIPNSPFAVRKGLPEDLKKAIKDALLELPEKQPVLWQTIAKLYRRSPSDLKCIPVDDHTYDGLRKYAAQVKDFNFVEK